jgi:hypothetical protein
VLSDNILKEDIHKHITEIDGKIWLFSDVYNNEVVALVNSEDNPDVYKPRFFRVSGSDHQFKAHPGFRENISKFIIGPLMKGGENLPEHHYVQSNKLHPIILNALQSLPKSKVDINNHPHVNNFLPKRTSIRPFLTDRPEDYTFSEKQVDIKNKDWAILKSIMMENFDIFDIIINSYDHNVNQLYELVKRIKESRLYKMRVLNDQEFSLLEESYQNLSSEDKTKTFRYLKHDKTAPTDIRKAFVDQISNLFCTTTERMITFGGKLDVVMEKTHFIPDFSQPPISSYQLNEGEINIEEYDQISPEGDHLCWAMARDKKGRVFINNIYDPRVGIDNYGTPKQKANFGLLVYKTEDYPSQTMFIKSQYVRPSPGEYNDISLLIEMEYPVRKYKEALVKKAS